MTEEHRQPLWQVMIDAHAEAFLQPNSGLCQAKAAEIRALRDWLVPSKPQPAGAEFWPDTDSEREWQHNQNLRAILTAEADRAERGE